MGVTAETGAGLSIVNASYRIGGTTILDKVSVDVRCGRVLVLVGPNGAGKSTLLGMLAGDADPTGGDVLLHGRPLGQWPPRERARRRAVLLQSNQLVFPFTAQQVIEMGRAPWIGTEESADDDRAIARAIEATDSGHLLTRAFPTLSGGEKARVSLARVLAQETPIVLLDEPTAALDLRHQEDVLRIARDRARAGAAVVIVLHDLSLAAAYADEVMILDAGRAVASGSPNEVLTAERIEAVYGLAVRILRDDDTGRPLVVPRRGRIRRPHSADGRTAT
ncbi:MAG: heme ABC transporter ATP-binding protein [Microbacterium gubbeenense]|uniref:heme ABC transporter ATP-binding protein n=1 Tax=Microbacterium TaxID=33882 RepID=UPI00068403BD